MITFLVQRYFPGPRSIFNPKKVSARDLLGSFTSDIDIALDWWFYVETVIHFADEVPDVLQKVHLGFTILGTLSWLALASDGRAVDWFVIKPLQCMECLWFSLRRCCCCQSELAARSSRKVGASSSKVMQLWEQSQSEAEETLGMDLSSVQLSTGFLLLCGVIMEDVPQVILTFLIQQHKGEDGTAGLVIANMLTSVYNAFIKLADAYDQRQDIVSVSERS
ncbi:expressed unknown protein [Seminavis robusta]|uniref:Uncharacterized protein n=1 Tax=Seminavis robusta TaxID=568900 RepID=A0A9N8H4Q8_9STRA|nr:expressed unknown protein [Seminavis robusta]|eukprot:Sro91_g047720.1 n/a (221) ;mRNA; r:62910-63572